jgi:DNA-binding transcriptional ArsR family regulator
MSPAAPATDVDDDLWSAIGDPTRRRLLDLLLEAGDGTATTLSEQVTVTRQAVTKHLAVLDRAGLVHATTSGRERRYRVDDRRLARAAAQLAQVGAAWDDRLGRIKRLAETLQRERDRTAQDRTGHRHPTDQTDETDQTDQTDQTQTKEH